MPAPEASTLVPLGLLLGIALPLTIVAGTGGSTYRRAWWLPAVFWAVFIMVLTQMPWGDPHIQRRIWWTLPLDKWVHTTFFLMQTATLVWGLFRANKGHSTAQVLLISWLVAVAYGALTEVLQYAIGIRHGDWADLLADASGALLGLAIAGIPAVRRPPHTP